MKKPFFIAVSIIILLAVASVLSVLFMNKATVNPIAEIYSDGKLLYSIDLNSVSEPYEITVTDQTGGVNIIQVRKGEIGVIEADCPDKTCINMGFTGSSSLRIICVPHRLEIRITAGKARPDGVSR